MALFDKIADSISTLSVEIISESRKQILQPLIDFIQQKVNQQEEVHLNFICTHNSRRSHLSQVWAQTMAHYFTIQNVFCYSAGTEATALFPVVVDTLKNSGFKIHLNSGGSNPVYTIRYSEDEQAIIGFSKELSNSFNPKSNFAAVMTCSQADDNCPFIEGAEQRIPITFEDPKAFDNSPQQVEKYNERSLQIATELLFVFSKVQPLN